MSSNKNLTTHEIIGRVCGTFDQASLAWNDLVGSDEAQRQLSGLKTMVTAGRSLTNVLQKLKTPELGFDEWYAPIQVEMKTDPVLRYFHTLRNTILKEGLPKPIFATLQSLDRGRLIGIAEVGIGEDQFGIWVHGLVERGDALGSEHRLRNIRLPNPPSEHFGRIVEGTSIDHLGRLYLNYLEQRIVKPAIETFGNART